MSTNFCGHSEYHSHMANNQPYEPSGGSTATHMHPLFPFQRLAADPHEASQAKMFPPHEWSSENPDTEYKPFLFVNYD